MTFSTCSTSSADSWTDSAMRRGLLATGDVHRRRCGGVLVPEARAARPVGIRRNQERLDRPRAESRRAEGLLVGFPGEPVEVKIHGSLAEVERAAEPGPLVESLVEQAEAEAVLPVIDDGLRRLEDVGDAGHEWLPRLEVVVDRLGHPAQLLPVLRVVQE